MILKEANRVYEVQRGQTAFELTQRKKKKQSIVKRKQSLQLARQQNRALHPALSSLKAYIIHSQTCQSSRLRGRRATQAPETRACLFHASPQSAPYILAQAEDMENYKWVRGSTVTVPEELTSAAGPAAVGLMGVPLQTRGWRYKKLQAMIIFTAVRRGRGLRPMQSEQQPQSFHSPWKEMIEMSHNYRGVCLLVRAAWTWEANLIISGRQNLFVGVKIRLGYPSTKKHQVSAV